MKNSPEEVNNLCTNLIVGDSVTVQDYTHRELKDMLSTIPEHFNLLRIDASRIMIVRVEVSSSVSSRIVDTLNSLEPFKSEFVPGHIQYIRTVCSRYGKRTGRAFAVKREGREGATVTEDFTRRVSFTAPEFNRYRLALMAMISAAKDKISIPDGPAFTDEE